MWRKEEKKCEMDTKMMLKGGRRQGEGEGKREMEID